MPKKILYSFVLLVLCFNFPSFGSELISGMVKIIDGDTLKIGEKKIRLYGIDAPEKAQNCKKIYFSFLIFNFQKDYKCGERSTLALSKKLNNKKVKCILEDNKDKYKRNIGTCYIENQDINRWLVKNGYAVAYTKYSRKYVLDEQYAMENKLGIWRGTFIRPEKWRRIMN